MEGWGSLSHHSSCSSSAEAGSHSTVQPGGKMDGQVTPATMSSREPVKLCHNVTPWIWGYKISFLIFTKFRCYPLSYITFFFSWLVESYFVCECVYIHRHMLSVVKWNPKKSPWFLHSMPRYFIICWIVVVVHPFKLKKYIWIFDSKTISKFEYK